MTKRVGPIARTPDRESGVVRSAPPGGEQSTHLVTVLGVSAPAPVSGPRDRRIATIAAAQRGRVARAQLLAAGVSSSTVDRLLAGGRLHRIHSGVYAVGHAAPIPLGRETAALLACGDGAVLSHRSAAALWGLRAECPPELPVDVTIAGRQAGRRSGVRVHRTRTLTAADIRLLEGLPVTAPARTLLDYAEILPLREVERALDQGVVRRIVRTGELDDVIHRANGRRGGPLLASILRMRAGPTLTRSEAEERFLALTRAAELPSPEVNARVNDYEVDFLWRAQRVVVEVDGFAFHRSRGAFERDRRKSARLKSGGWDTTRVTWLQMRDESYAVIARLATALGEHR